MVKHRFITQKYAFLLHIGSVGLSYLRGKWLNTYWRATIKTNWLMYDNVDILFLFSRCIIGFRSGHFGPDCLH